jgi:prepilin-type N-terminal cleavage/methylation domain-containing protein
MTLDSGNEDGFTLIELLVTMFIIGIVFAAFGLVISTTVRHTALITSESVTQHEVRTAVNQMAEDLREATVSSTSDTSPFVTTSTGGVMSATSLTFYAPDETFTTADQTDYHLREISYRVVNGELERASATSSNVSGAWQIPALGSWVPLVSGLVNTTVFSYLDAARKDGTQCPTTDPTAVRTVIVSVDVTVPGTSHVFNYSDSATPRETAPSLALTSSASSGATCT